MVVSAAPSVWLTATILVQTRPWLTEDAIARLELRGSIVTGGQAMRVLFMAFHEMMSRTTTRCRRRSIH